MSNGSAGGGYPPVVHLRRGGTSVVLLLGETTLPSVLHWGPDLGEVPEPELQALAAALWPPYLDSPITSQAAVAVLPQHAAGWLGRPGLSGSRGGRAWSPAFDEVSHVVEDAGSQAWPDGAAEVVRLRSVGVDRPSELEVWTELEVHPSGLVRLRAGVRNLGDVYDLLHVEPALPVPAEAVELLDMAGRHVHERTPQRRSFDIGSWVREAWGGRPGHDSPTVLCAGQRSFGFRSCRVWGVHVAFSGNQVFHAEHSYTGWRLLRGGELLLPGEVRLGRDEEYTTPWLVGSWGEGLDELAGRFHRYLRARPQHPKRPRPVLLNTWEAVYFDHDIDKLIKLAEGAAELGIERYVLDDGWFRHRRDDRAGLGDWFVDEGVYPDGLHPVVNRVRELGMEFGLWFEPEAINLDSDLAREHPEWVFQTNHGPGIASRYQHMLDLGHPEAFDYVLERMSSLVAEYQIAYIKWDHNRSLVDAGHSPEGTPGIHRQTEALYRLIGTLKERHPGLEIESCAGGGGRIDLGILELTDRIWVSDCIDALERQRLQRWTSLLLPPELMGTHVGSPHDHTTHRTHELSFRAGTAMWGHLGVEWDLTKSTEEDVAALRRWIELHKELRALLHSGDVVHADPTNPALLLEGVVAQDKRDALYRLAAVDHTLTWPPGRVTLPGLDPDLSYRVTLQPPGEGDPAGQLAPGWTAEGVTQTGRMLTTIGVHSPLLDAESLVLIRAQAV
jgi:alpha-galactosidase